MLWAHYRHHKTRNSICSFCLQLTFFILTPPRSMIKSCSTSANTSGGDLLDSYRLDPNSHRAGREGPKFQCSRASTSTPIPLYTCITSCKTPAFGYAGYMQLSPQTTVLHVFPVFGHIACIYLQFDGSCVAYVGVYLVQFMGKKNITALCGAVAASVFCVVRICFKTSCKLVACTENLCGGACFCPSLVWRCMTT